MMKKESQNSHSCLNPLPVSAVLQANSFILSKAQIYLSKFDRCLIKQFGPFKVMNYREVTMYFSLKWWKERTRANDIKFISEFVKMSQKFSQVCNWTGRAQGNQDLQVPQHLWFCSCDHICIGELEASIPHALVGQIYGQSGHAPFVILSLWCSDGRLWELAPVLLPSGKANSFPFSMHMRCAFGLFYYFC